MSKYLDIVSLINSDFYKKKQRISWHINHNEYYNLINEVYNLLDNLNSDIKNNKIYDVSKFSIFKNISTYLSHVYDYVILSKNNIKPEYSENSKIYIDNIWKKIPLSSDLEANRRNLTLKKNFVKKIYSKFLNLIPNTFFKYSILVKNHLIDDFLKKNKFKYLTIYPTSNITVNSLDNLQIKKLSQELSSMIIFTIEEKYFFLNDDQKKSINFIINQNLLNTNNDFKNYNGQIKNSKNIIIGTDTNPYYSFISYIAKNNGIKVWRFDHGGEKCFFDDDFHWTQVFYNIDVFVTYGKKWKNLLEKKIKTLNKNIEVKAIGSSHYKKIYNTYFGLKTNSVKKILYIPNSFVSESRQLTNKKIIDLVLYDWQKYLIKTLQNNNYEVIYKKHPKGKFHKENNLGKISNYETSEPMIKALKYADIVICDMAGTAFVEALCAGKDVIYIDMKQRPFNKASFEDLNSVVKIISTNEKNGIFYLNEHELLNSLTSPQKNIEKQRELVKDYWLESN